MADLLSINVGVTHTLLPSLAHVDEHPRVVLLEYGSLELLVLLPFRLLNPRLQLTLVEQFR